MDEAAGLSEALTRSSRAVDVLPGVGPAVKKKLQRLGLETIGDLLTHRPFRYEEPRARTAHRRSPG